VLGGLLGSPELDGYEVVGISGTSGGAICALLAWTALTRGEPTAARDLLEGFWADNSADSPMQSVTNAALVGASTLQNLGVLPIVSPYDVPVDGRTTFRELLERWVDFDQLEVDEAARLPVLLIGAVDVLSGRFRAFNSRRDRITAETILASAAIPSLFRAVRMEDGAYWDGLFSQNPPVGQLMDVSPDEVWVIQINPTRSGQVPRSVLDIADRRNELAGNLSLYQELHGIERINELLAGGLLVGERYRQVTVRILELARSRTSRELGPASKLNRDPKFLEELMAQGRQQARQFLTVLSFEQLWRRQDTDAVQARLTDDVEVTQAGPAPLPEGVRAASGPHDVGDLLTSELRVDLTHKQMAGDRVTWTVRAEGGDEAESREVGEVAAEFHDGKVRRIVVGASSAP
jgi:NTE family protein